MDPSFRVQLRLRFHDRQKMSSRKSRLAPSKHHLQQPNEPPAVLSGSQTLAKIIKIHGNSIYTVLSPPESEFLVELPMRFRNAVWVRRGSYVLVETAGFLHGKIGGEITDVILEEKVWRKMPYWSSPCLIEKYSSADSHQAERIQQERM